MRDSHRAHGLICPAALGELLHHLLVIGLAALPCNAAHCSRCLLTLLLSVLQLQLLHHLHKAVHCGGLERNGARVETGLLFPRDFTVSFFHV